MVTMLSHRFAKKIGGFGRPLGYPQGDWILSSV